MVETMKIEGAVQENETERVRTLLQRIEAGAKKREDDEPALAALSAILTARAGARVEALGFGAIQGAPVPLVVVAAGPVPASAAIEALMGAGLELVHSQAEPPDADWPDYPRGKVVAWYRRSGRLTRRLARAA